MVDAVLIKLDLSNATATLDIPDLGAREISMNVWPTLAFPKAHQTVFSC